VMVVVHGFCLLGVICRQVGQDEGGKGGAHQCQSINNDERRPDVIVHCLVATLLLVMWHLVSI